MDIAVYFSADARRAAAAATYYTRSPGLRKGTFRRTADGYCPLGILLRADGYGTHYMMPDSAIATAAIVERLGGGMDRTEGLRRYQAVRAAVAAWITAWDDGTVPDLVAALDLPAKRGPSLGKFAASAIEAPQTDSESTAPRRRELRQAVRE